MFTSGPTRVRSEVQEVYMLGTKCQQTAEPAHDVGSILVQRLPTLDQNHDVGPESNQHQVSLTIFKWPVRQLSQHYRSDVFTFGLLML